MTITLTEVRTPGRTEPEDDLVCLDEGRQATTRRDSREILLAAQLGCLASQHHASEYSHQKYGSRGAPSAYIPLSLQFPEHFKQLLDQQAIYADCRAWWLCQKPSKHASLVQDNSKKTPGLDGPAFLSRPHNPTTLQEDLLSAISSPLTPQTEIPLSSAEPVPPIKTSQSHPLNISMIAPPELLPAIATHMSPSSQPSPIMFEVPLSYQLHRIVTVPLFPPQLSIPTIPAPPLPQLPIASRPSTTNIVNLFWNQNFVRKAFVSSTPTQPSTGVQATAISLSVTSSVQTHASASPYSVMKKTARPNSVSLASAPRTLPSTDYSSRVSDDYEKVGHHLSHAIPSLLGVPHRTNTPLSREVASRKSSNPASQDVLPSPPRRLGNLFLSSCPGKKVRLSGPVNGRGGVCRDLRQDLRRIKELGVGCVICCLDDEELHYLGAPWEEYSRTADELGLDVLRIPTPEGLAPADPEVLDGHLVRLIQTYTLRGTPILVHCRGGVGRAGLVACCWALKLGLCGWIETRPTRSSRLSFTAPEDLSELPPMEEADGVRRDTFQLVERAITLVRRRRSYKAIETFEQVKFLVDYVEFLREKAKTGEVAVGSVLDRDIRIK